MYCCRLPCATTYGCMCATMSCAALPRATPCCSYSAHPSIIIIVVHRPPGLDLRQPWVEQSGGLVLTTKKTRMMMMMMMMMTMMFFFPRGERRSGQTVTRRSVDGRLEKKKGAVMVSLNRLEQRIATENA